LVTGTDKVYNITKNHLNIQGFYNFVIINVLMIIHQGYTNLNILNPVVTLGIFDGVHLGHRALISRLVSKARSVTGESVIITFHPHPRLVLSENKSNLAFLTSLEEKISLLEKEGVGRLIIIPFDHNLSDKEACEFIEEVLVKKIRTKYLIAGYNHHFGRKGNSDFESIQQCAESFGIVVEQVPALITGEGVVSSSIIREALLKGELDEANSLLGYDYFLNGTVVEGKHLGKKIGFPTANIKTDYKNKLMPKAGVYAVEVIISGMKYKGMLSIGSNPTVNDDPYYQTIEVNIFDFENKIYKSKICVVFRRRIRDEFMFDSIALLVEQLHLDKKIALWLLNK
jgi:riboflavin kinase/FMN adenylyltransferase